MRLFALYMSLGILPSTQAAYQVLDNYTGENFFNMFEFYAYPDAARANVTYVSKTTAMSPELHIAYLDGTAATFGADSESIATSPGRKSVRLESQHKYNNCLVVADIKHMPGNACGVWPAMWLLGDTSDTAPWPTNGEIDVIEGINLQTSNFISLHYTVTGSTSSSSGSSSSASTCSFTGQTNPVGNNVGIVSGTAGGSTSYGDGFNANGGGVYAVEVNATNISIWFFPRSGGAKIPADVYSTAPNPSAWDATPGGGLLATYTSANCNLQDHFREQKIVFNVDFCGTWASGDFATGKTCASKANGGNCAEWVANNPTAFAEAYFTVNSLVVYQQG